MQGIRMLVLIPSLVLAIGSLSGAATIPVPADGDIQAAIDSAQDGDTVLVAPGDYEFDTPITFGGKAITVHAENGPEETVIRMAQVPANPDRASVVIFEEGETENSVLEGFTITGGQGSSAAGRESVGGGVLCISGSSPTLRDCALSENNARRGGGLACLGTGPVLVDCSITSNGGFFDDGIAAGGAVYLNDGASPVFENCAIEGNSLAVTSPTTLTGGGIYSGASEASITGCSISENTLTAQEGDAWGGGLGVWNGSSVTLENCRIESNHAEASGFASGGGLLLAESTAVVKNSTFRGNSIGRDDLQQATGGGLHFSEVPRQTTITGCAIEENELIAAGIAHGAGIYCQTNAQPVLTDCRIARNRATAENSRGGGLQTRSGSAPALTRCEIVENTLSGSSSASGGGLLAFESPATLTDCEISRNVADASGGPEGTARGGGVFSSDADIVLRNSPIASNRALGVEGAYGGGLFFQNGLTPELEDCRLENCRISGNFAESAGDFAHGGGIFCTMGASPTGVQLLVAGNRVSAANGSMSGGGIYCVGEAAPRWDHSSITENAATTGAGVYCSESSSATSFVSCIVWGNEGRAIVGTPWVSFSCVEGGVTWQGGEGNIEGNPQFCSPGRWESGDVWIAGEYGLPAGSPCLGTGEAGTDMGADLGTCVVLGFLRGDCNSDGHVDISDAIGSLFFQFMGGTLNCVDTTDVDDNGITEVTDIIYLLRYLFLEDSAPKSPFPDCGPDVNDDTFPRCEYPPESCQ